MDIVILEYHEKYARDAVFMWRASKEHALGIEDPHPIEEQLQFLTNILTTTNSVWLAVEPEADRVRRSHGHRWKKNSINSTFTPIFNAVGSGRDF